MSKSISILPYLFSFVNVQFAALLSNFQRRYCSFIPSLVFNPVRFNCSPTPPYACEYCVSTPRVYTLARSKIVQSDLDEATKEIELEKSGNEIWSSHKQRQYDFISKHLNAGEFVEIYTEEVHGTNFNLGPPETECTMTLEELLDLPMPEKLIDKYKTTIYKENKPDGD